MPETGVQPTAEVSASVVMLTSLTTNQPTTPSPRQIRRRRCRRRRRRRLQRAGDRSAGDGGSEFVCCCPHQPLHQQPITPTTLPPRHNRRRRFDRDADNASNDSGARMQESAEVRRSVAPTPPLTHTRMSDAPSLEQTSSYKIQMVNFCFRHASPPFSVNSKFDWSCHTSHPAVN